MKEYGAKKATEFTAKQVGVIYAKAKAGEMKVEKWVMSDLYNLADYYGFDDNHSVESAEREVLTILDAVFAGDTEKAQELLDAYAEKTYSLLGRKSKERLDHTVVE